MDIQNRKPILVGFISVVRIAEQIDSVAITSGYETRWIEPGEIIPEGEPYIPSYQLAEHVTGPVAILIDLITRLRPGLIIFDLDFLEIPWNYWISILKSVPATRRYPVLCFGSRIDGTKIEAIKRSGADVIVSKRLFIDEMPSLLKDWVVIPDYPGILKSCNEPLSNLAKRGIELFNQRDFFEAHEILEEAWNEDQSLGRELYRAILQVAVAYLQIERKNYSGAIKMFWRVRQWIEPLPKTCRGVNVEVLRMDSEKVYKALLSLGPERIGEFDRSLFTAVNVEG